MGIIPSRHERESINSAVNGFDDPQVLQAVRDIAEAKAWRPKLADFAGDETFSNMLNSILMQRIGLALVSPEELAQAGMSDNLADYGYMFEPEQSVWSSATKDEAEQRGLPWYRTSREAIDALYDDALRDDNGKLVADFERSELYDEMNKRLADMTSQMVQEDPSILGKLVKGGVMKNQRYRGEDGLWSERAVPDEYSEKNLAYKLASMAAPTRTLGMVTDPELRTRSSAMEKARNVGLDALETYALLWNPAGKLATNLAAKAIGVPVRKALPKLADWGSGRGYAWLNNVGENVLGGTLNSMGFQGADELLDSDNSMEQKPFDMGDALLTGAVSGAIPMLAGTSRGLSGKLLKGKPKLKQMMADSYNLKPMGREVSPNELGKEADELLKAKTYNDFVNAPYIRTQTGGYPHYATPKVVPFQKATDMTPADVDDALLDRVIRATGDKEASERWFAENVGQRGNLAKQGDLQIGNSDRSAQPYLVEKAETFRKNQAEHPVSSYKTEFAMPITQAEFNNPKLLDNLSQSQRQQRYSRHRMDNAERARRERLIDEFTPKDPKTRESRPTGRPEAGGIDLRPVNGKTRKGINLVRFGAYHAIPELTEGSAFNVIRNGVPLRQRKEEE